MPQISSLPVLPAAPGLPSTPVAGPASAPAALQTADADSNEMPFFVQLKAALKSLASVAMPRGVTPGPVADQITLVDQPAVPVMDKVELPKEVEHQAEEVVLPEALAALGLVPVPATFQTPVIAEPRAANAVSADAPRIAAVPAPLQNTQSAPPPPSPATAVTTDPQPVMDDSPVEEVAVPQHAQATPSAAHADAAPVRHAEHAHQAAPASTAPAAPSAAPIATQHAASHGSGFGHANAETEGHSSSSSTTPAVPPHEAVDESPVTDQSTNTLAANAVTANTAPNTATAVLPPHVRPSEVANQIARQAELYRLPGNRGVRIQLHPEDLGGVDVTLRYSASGGIQLHINVEHASTGALVQAGWTELRDALATQGISPDRLVMSISAPAQTNSLDLSSNGNGSRQQPDLAGFSQGQSGGQPRQDGTDNGGTRSWSATREPSASSSDDSGRVAATAAGRIDYRV